jgi:hypothetical protein
LVEHDESVQITSQMAQMVDVEGDSRWIRVLDLGLRAQAVQDGELDSKESG